MPELDTISIKGFKSIASIEKLKLGAINVVIGPNGSGKSNFIGVFAFLHAIREGHLQDYVIKAGGADKVLHFGTKVTKKLQIRVSFRDERNQYEINLQPTEADELVPESEVVSFWDKVGFPSKSYSEALARAGKEAGISASKSTKIASYVRDHLDRWRLYHFHDTSSTSPMKKTADVNDNRYLRPDGSNLAAFLYYLQKKQETEYSLIRRTVQRVAPFFVDFQLEPQKLNPEKIRLEWRHQGSEAYFDAPALSDGSLRFIALATLFLQPERYRPSVILVDEPELGLHPYAITLLASLIKQASVKTQVIISTQSPFLLDHFQPEDVLVADRVDGGTQFTRLDPSRLGSWLQEYSLGQLWEKMNWAVAPGWSELMSRLLIHVEGETEETFVNEVLASHLYGCGYTNVSARLVGNARQRDRRGGIRAWSVVRRDILHHLKEDAGCLSTTMVDFYALPQSGGMAWPGREEAAQLAFAEKAVTVENALLADICTEMGTDFDQSRFVPYVMMHEFEGFLFSDATRFGHGIGRPDLSPRFQAIRDEFATPEEINDSPFTAPSKRIRDLVPGYEKPLMGTLAVLEIGLDAIRQECPLFRRWLK